MKILFTTKGTRIELVDEEKLVFRITTKNGCEFLNAKGERVSEETISWKEETCDEDEDPWCEENIKNQGLVEPLLAESTTEIEWEIDDGFGNFGFQNRAGEFVIEPQYAYAHEFTQGLAAVNLNRTWYRSEKGNRYYENHYGYINERGQTVIGFQFDEAEPFNKYGVAVVSDLIRGRWLIDTEGNEIPGTRFPYLCHHYDYDTRFLEFSYDEDGDIVGLYDTKERKILFEPSFEAAIEWKENLICIYPKESEHSYYINDKGEILFPWLRGKEFLHAERPNRHGISVVDILDEARTRPSGRREYLQGLYSSKERYLLPAEYEWIWECKDNIFVCKKEDETIIVVQTEEGD